jgi:hypothetical protein
MSAYIFNKAIIEDAGGGNPVEYTAMLVEDRNVMVDFGSVSIDDDQLSATAKTVEISVDILGDSILSDTRIAHSSALVNPARITLASVTGGVTLMVDSIRLRSNPRIGEVLCHSIKGKRAASMTSNSQIFKKKVLADGGTIVNQSSLSILNSLSGASLICPCNAGKVDKLYYTDSLSPLITFT